MLRTTRTTRRLLSTVVAAGALGVSFMLPSRSDGPMVPAPKLPPPPQATYTSDGTVIYPDGTILYASGEYESPDGTTGSL